MILYTSITKQSGVLIKKFAIHKFNSLVKGDFSLPKSSYMDDCLIPIPNLCNIFQTQNIKIYIQLLLYYYCELELLVQGFWQFWRVMLLRLLISMYVNCDHFIIYNQFSNHS